MDGYANHLTRDVILNLDTQYKDNLQQENTETSVNKGVLQLL